MASAYPGALDSFTTTHTNATVAATTHPNAHNDLADAVNKIEAALGTNPVGARDEVMLADSGYLAWNFHPVMAGAALLTNQQVQACLVPFRAGDTVTNLHVGMNVAGATLTYARMALYSKDGATQHGISGDAIAAFQGSVGRLTIALGTPYAVTATGSLYVCVLCVGTTMPSLRRIANIESSLGSVGSGKPLFGIQTAQTTFPASLTLTASGVSFWAAAS